MGNQLAVLILGNTKHKELKEILFDLGFIPIERRDMIQAIEMLHHERFVAVFIDYDHVEIDALEFILNVRDMKLSIPVIIIGELKENWEQAALQEQRRVHYFPELKNNYSSKLKVNEIVRNN
ncbi:hypothetical protein GF337_07125 [candidate division KSB1 bacterium]|nr:hypothetical protein [candidate division KSB1 bacterium]